MGRSGIKSRKGKKPQHLPKVGTPQEEHHAMHQEQRAVMANMGIKGKGGLFWIATIVVIAIVVIGLFAWIWVA
ncbi:MAG: hypothetical protein WEB19_01595 [Acidimicrobiia bacterium]